MSNRNIILASKSPRRVELMKMAGFTFDVKTKNVDEIHPDGVDVYSVPLYLAQKKAEAFANEISPSHIVIGADTVVILNGKIYEKPADRTEAIDMLSKLSGNMHEVVTGVHIYSAGKQVSFSDKTSVYFNSLTNEEIAYYVDTYKPYDKAGSYACQEWIGAVGIQRFEGDFFNVMGLPVNKVYAALKTF
ncbi:MAG: septum formation protein Maf [Chitinophagales bacterium]|nr:septum formation protein Maf [Chitinophagales bacterium]